MRVLPGAAAQYQPVWAGDTPSTDTRDVGGIEASTAIGETGWQLTAPVGDAWVELHLAAPGLGTVGSPFDGIDPDTVLDRIADLAAPVFSTLAAASPEQLAWPRSESMRQGDAVCNGGLNPQGIGMALQAGVIEAQASDPTSTPPQSFGDAAAAAARSFSCDYLVDGIPGPHVTLLVGAGEQFDVLKQADLATTFEPIDISALPSYLEGDEALRVRSSRTGQHRRSTSRWVTSCTRSRATTARPPSPKRSSRRFAEVRQIRSTADAHTHARCSAPPGTFHTMATTRSVQRQASASTRSGTSP